MKWWRGIMGIGSCGLEERRMKREEKGGDF
jgi:hypothetical protein